MVIYGIFSRLNRCNSFSRYRASLADSHTDGRKKKGRRKAEESQKIDDLSILVTRRSGTSTMLSSKMMVPLLMKALGNA